MEGYSSSIYGLSENESENINLRDYQNKEYNCASVNPHNGHGTTQGCNSTLTCSNTFSFANDIGMLTHRIGLIKTI